VPVRPSDAERLRIAELPDRRQKYQNVMAAPVPRSILREFRLLWRTERHYSLAGTQAL
jgi:hypothetical protein